MAGSDVTDNRIGPNFGKPLWHRECAAEKARLTAQLAERDAEIARLREALSGMLESYELCMGDELAFSDLTKDMLRGAFINEPARARAAIAARGGEV